MLDERLEGRASEAGLGIETTGNVVQFPVKEPLLDQEKYGKFSDLEKAIDFLPEKNIEQAQQELARLRNELQNSKQSFIIRLLKRLFIGKEDERKFLQLQDDVNDLSRKLKLVYQEQQVEQARLLGKTDVKTFKKAA